jgi:hypothetical protein
MTRRPFCFDTYTDALNMSADEIALNIKENLEFLRTNSDNLSADNVQTIYREIRAFRYARLERNAY